MLFIDSSQLVDSSEYFDQIWFPSEPPGVAVRCPPLQSSKSGTRQKSATGERPWPAESPESGSFQRPRRVSSASSPVTGSLSSSFLRLNLISRKGQSKLAGDPPPPPPPTRCPVTLVRSRSAAVSIIGRTGWLVLEATLYLLFIF